MGHWKYAILLMKNFNSKLEPIYRFLTRFSMNNISNRSNGSRDLNFQTTNMKGTRRTRVFICFNEINKAFRSPYYRKFSTFEGQNSSVEDNLETYEEPKISKISGLLVEAHMNQMVKLIKRYKYFFYMELP